LEVGVGWPHGSQPWRQRQAGSTLCSAGRRAKPPGASRLRAQPPSLPRRQHEQQPVRNAPPPGPCWVRDMPRALHRRARALHVTPMIEAGVGYNKSMMGGSALLLIVMVVMMVV